MSTSTSAERGCVEMAPAITVNFWMNRDGRKPQEEPSLFRCRPPKHFLQRRIRQRRGWLRVPSPAAPSNCTAPRGCKRGYDVDTWLHAEREL